ncbi:putative bifunctional diguanylate cyclase/phosphodiesterase [Cognaticolwellia mytili]|uniref:putative bifunctional diguanylate cyclase/phosphodiesterase n=1 Tax=Cognaticolwellia mytili TaxID=1888913 RepID=UPI000A173ACE|nr:EAL domain-containing protein [Cognaticolwellia mytili]
MVRGLKQKILAKILPLSQFTIDVVVTTLLAVITFWLAQKYDVFEYLVKISRTYEEYEVDEILTLVMISALSLAALTIKNNKRLKQEVLKRVKAEQSIKKMAFYDSLTGLPNRELCINRFEHILNQAARTSDLAAVLFIDLDNFKEVNDNYGHEAGDVLLKQFTARLLGELRKGDTLSRFAGDEFIILLESVSSVNNVTILAKKILDCIQLPFQIDVNEITVGMSVGIAIYPSDGQEASKLLKHADTAMYHAKHEGKNTFRFYSSELNTQARNKLIIASQLRQALERNEFMLNFQPIIDVASKKIKAAEALLRWDNQTLGNVPPDVFIPIAEEIGLINTIGEWVLLQACKQSKVWHNMGYNHLVISVNMSARQLGQKNFFNVVKSCLAATQLPPKSLELELTETAIMKDVDAALYQLEKLKKLGVSIALDDFGTGYSSIAYLRKLCINRIKIDRSFIQHIPENHEDIMTTNAIVSLAKNLGIAITAEGIETIEQQQFIENTPVDSIQGYFIAKPMLASEFEQLLKE